MSMTNLVKAYFGDLQFSFSILNLVSVIILQAKMNFKPPSL